MKKYVHKKKLAAILWSHLNDYKNGPNSQQVSFLSSPQVMAQEVIFNLW